MFQNQTKSLEMRILMYFCMREVFPATILLPFLIFHKFFSWSVYLECFGGYLYVFMF